MRCALLTVWATRGSRFMRCRVMDSSSQRSGSSSTTNTAGFVIATLFLPALRVAEDDSENTTAAAARFIEQHRAVQLTQLASDEQTQSSAAFAAGEKRLENAIDRFDLDSRATIRDFQIRTVAWIQAAQPDRQTHRAADV